MLTSTKHKSHLLFAACLLLTIFLFTSYGITAAGPKSPAETITTVILTQEPDSISPLVLKVKLGTTIVFFNNDGGPVTIKFLEKLGLACKAPVNFYADLWGNYETGAIAQGATASLCFIYKGTYRYDVKRLIGEGDKISEQIATGTIIADE